MTEVILAEFSLPSSGKRGISLVISEAGERFSTNMTMNASKQNYQPQLQGTLQKLDVPLFKTGPLCLRR